MNLILISSEFKRQLERADSREIEAGGGGFLYDLLGDGQGRSIPSRLIPRLAGRNLSKAKPG